MDSAAAAWIHVSVKDGFFFFFKKERFLSLSMCWLPWQQMAENAQYVNMNVVFRLVTLA